MYCLSLAAVFATLAMIALLCLVVVNLCLHTACTQDEVNKVFAAAKAAQQVWARTPLWKRAEALHKVAGIMRQHAQPMADCLVKEIAKPAKDSMTEVVRSADLIDYTAEEGVRSLGEGQLLNSDSFPGQSRNKICLVSKVEPGFRVQKLAQQRQLQQPTLEDSRGWFV